MMEILATYGFVPARRNHKALWWGVGSLVWGSTAEVRQVGKNRYEVKYHTWYYDSYGEPIEDKEETLDLYGAQMLAYLVERLPLRSWSVRGY